MTMLPENSPRLWKPPRKTSDSARSQQIVAIGNERAPHADKPAGTPLFLAIHHLSTHIHLKRRFPIEDGGLRRPAKEMLSLAKIKRLIKFSEELTIRAGAKPRHFL